MRSRQGNARKKVGKDGLKNVETNGSEQPIISRKSLRSKKTETNQPKHDLSLFEALVECATREDSSGTLSEEDPGEWEIVIYISDGIAGMIIFQHDSIFLLEHRNEERQSSWQ